PKIISQDSTFGNKPDKQGSRSIRSLSDMMMVVLFVVCALCAKVEIADYTQPDRYTGTPRFTRCD
ncbi:MAG: hypothetical protein ACYDGM_14625, partial [Vulcanimicrobiaceae bacterium]